MKAPVFDLHTHVIPGVDDGPVTPAEALRLVEKLKASMPSGSLVAATPHYSSGISGYALHSRAMKAFDFAKKVSDRDLTVVCAGEVKLGVRSTKVHELVCYPGTRWVLVEFSPRAPWFCVIRRTARLLNRGYRPLIAHVERYGWSTSGRIRLLASMGSAVSVSLRSLSSPRFGKAGRRILEAGLCHVVTSDCHRESDMVLGAPARETVEQLCPGGWYTLVSGNPRRILDDEPLPPLRDICCG